MTEEQKGEWYLIASGILWSLFPIVTVLTVRTISPIFAAGIATLIAAIVFMLWVLWRNEWHFIHNHAWKDILISSFLVGVLYYGILFTGLSYTSAGNAAILGLSQVFFSFLLLNILFKLEKNEPLQYLGAVFMVLGAGIVLFPQGGVSMDWGGILIVFAAACAPLGNWYAKRATTVVSPHFLMMVRSSIAGVFLMLLSALFEGGELMFNWSVVALLVFNGAILLGVSKIFWQEAIKRITIAKANAMGAFEPLLTLLFAFFLLGDVPTSTQIVALFPIIVGMYLLMRKNV